jgi:hypothetical protein
MKSDFNCETFAIVRESMSDTAGGDKSGFSALHIRSARDGGGVGFIWGSAVTRSVCVPSRVSPREAAVSSHDSCPGEGREGRGSFSPAPTVGTALPPRVELVVIDFSTSSDLA